MTDQTKNIKMNSTPLSGTMLPELLRRSSLLAFFLTVATHASETKVSADPVAKPIPVRVLPKHDEHWRNYATVTFDHLREFTPKKNSLSKHGGRMDRREEATGFFHAKKLADRRVLVDPEGFHFYSLGVSVVVPTDDSPDSIPAFENKFGSVHHTREWVPSTVIYHFRERFEGVEKWTQETYQVLRGDLHFNTIGRWSMPELFHRQGLPVSYVVGMDILGSFASAKGKHVTAYGSTELKGNIIPVFDPDLPEHIDRVCQELAPIRDDSWVLGIMSDNEVPLFEENILKRYLALDADDPGAREARAWLAARGKSEDAITPEDDREFCFLVCSKYFGMVREAIRKYAPNHMYLGTRFHKSILTQPSAYEAAGRYMDVIAINLYHRWNIDQAITSKMAELAGKPLMVTEWYAKGMDSGLRNVSGAGFLVETQEDRGRFYENFTISLLRNPNMVGWHWFRYMDDGPLRTNTQSCNKGLLDVHFNPHRGLTKRVARINENVFGLGDYLLPLKSGNLPDRNQEMK
jgi:hypothetical protein